MFPDFDLVFTWSQPIINSLLANWVAKMKKFNKEYIDVPHCHLIHIFITQGVRVEETTNGYRLENWKIYQSFTLFIPMVNDFHQLAGLGMDETKIRLVWEGLIFKHY